MTIKSSDRTKWRVERSLQKGEHAMGIIFRQSVVNNIIDDVVGVGYLSNEWGIAIRNPIIMTAVDLCSFLQRKVWQVDIGRY